MNYTVTNKTNFNINNNMTQFKWKKINKIYSQLNFWRHKSNVILKPFRFAR